MDMQEMLKNEDTMQRFADAIAARIKHPCQFTPEDIAFIRAGSSWHCLFASAWKGAIIKLAIFVILSVIGVSSSINLYEFIRGNGNRQQTEARR